MIFLNEEMCRLCLCKNPNVHIYGEVKDNVSSVIKRCCPVIDLSKEDDLPEKICEECLNTLTICDRFLTKCIESDKLIREQHNLHSRIVKLEPNEIKFEDKNDFVNEIPDNNLLYSDILLEDLKIQRDYKSSIKVNKRLLKQCSTRKSKVSKSRKCFDRKANKLKHDVLLQCNVCGKQFKRNSLKNHMRIHYNEKFNKHMNILFNNTYICDICKKIFHNKDYLRKHIQTEHLGKSKTTICDICGKAVNKPHISSHRRTHSNQRTFTCQICFKTFTLSKYLHQHMMVHTEGKVSCHVCKKEYKTLKSLKRHNQDVHLAKITYNCDMCNKKCKSKRELKIHTRSHTQECSYQCRFCDSKFAMSSTLVQHERLHLGVTPYMCPSCPKAFAQLGNMKSHFRNNHKDIVFSKVYKPKTSVKNSPENGKMSQSSQTDSSQNAIIDNKSIL